MIAYALLAAAAVALGAGTAHADGGSETVRFIQYLDESTALEEVRKGNLDMYYWGVPSDRLSDPRARDGLKVYESTGGTYSILLNPAETDTFNPFSIREIRFAVNYLLDRNLVVNVLMGGYGAPMSAHYGPYDPEYISILDDLESYDFRHNPARAHSIIGAAMTAAGGVMEDGVWAVDGEPVEITFVIRSDDVIRKSLGEVLSRELENAGFAVHRDYGDLNKAFVAVYGADPADLGWHLYTEGWGSGGFVRYDSVGLAQMYAPWYSYMPGFGDPAFWNYEHPRLDALTRAIFNAEFGSAAERTALVRQAVAGGVDESVRIFLASRLDQYVVNENTDGVVNDFGAGIPSRFTTINARTDDNRLDIGVKQIYQGSWNPVGGLTDLYSTHIWDVVHDPPTFRHPYSGGVIPVAAEWEVKTAGPNGALAVPADAILWDTADQSWRKVGGNVNATSAVVYHFTFGGWHHGIPKGMDDILYSAYFTMEWGTNEGESDRTVDSSYTPQQEEFAKKIKGIRVVDQNTLEVYVDYWHFDEGEIASWAALDLPMPWELYRAMELAVLDGKTAFSRSAATSNEVSWLSLLIQNDVDLMEEYLTALNGSGTVPAPLADYSTDADSRYAASLRWIDRTGHAVVSNGPYMVDGYSPESRTITLLHSDQPYPFAYDKWSMFENVSTPRITGIDIPNIVTGDRFTISISVEDATAIKYFVTDSAGEILSAKRPVSPGDNSVPVFAPGLAPGAASIKIFALSEEVLRPDSYSGRFFVTGSLPSP